MDASGRPRNLLECPMAPHTLYKQVVLESLSFVYRAQCEAHTF